MLGRGLGNARPLLGQCLTKVLGGEADLAAEVEELRLAELPFGLRGVAARGLQLRGPRQHALHRRAVERVGMSGRERSAGVGHAVEIIAEDGRVGIGRLVGWFFGQSVS